MTGSIPPELGNLSNLYDLSLSDNQLSGDITAAMSALRTNAVLTTLSLGSNGCFTVTDPTLVTWLDGFDVNWDDGCFEDTDAPVLESVGVSPDPVAAGQSITITWRLTDASGVTFTTAFVRNPSDGFLSGCGSGSATRISGTATDGTYEQTCTIPPAAQGGTYTVQIHAEEPNGNTYSGNSATFTVQAGAIEDTDAPVLESVGVSPDPVAAGQSITITWRLTDASGVTFTTAFVRNPSDGFLSGCGSGSATRISGTATDGTYEQTCTIPPAAQGGTYTVQIHAEEPNGNTYSGNSATFTVQAGAIEDTDAPVLESVGVSPDPVAAGQSITITWRLTDASGVTFTTAFVRNPSDGFLSGCGSGSATRISGTATDGTYEQTCTIPPAAQGGTYTVQIHAEEPNGNTYSGNSATFTVQ